MTQLRPCLFSQTPVVRFVRDFPDAEPTRPLAAYREGADYLPSPGGVTRMVQAFLRRGRETGRLRDPVWVGLASGGPRAVRLDGGVSFEQVRLPPAERQAYAHAKGAVWDAVHGIPPDPAEPAPDVPRGLDHLAQAMAARARRLHLERPFDAFYVHDFQLLPLAGHLPGGVPRAFRWHVPVSGLEGALREYVVEKLNAYDAVIVSTEGYARTMRRWGVKVPVHASHPYLDESRARAVTEHDVAAFERRWGLAPDDVVFLVVARLDPMKRQDVAVRALARIAKDVPRAKLLLVGGGGFSGGRNGLGLPAATRWRAHLETLAEELGVRDRVVMTGGISDVDLDVAYTRARAVLLPSGIEGFGLAVVEGWLYGKPVVVSDRAGVAELVEDGENGFVSPAGDAETLAARMRMLAEDQALAAALGEGGRRAAAACHVRRGADEVLDVLDGIVQAHHAAAAAAAAADAATRGS